MVTLRRKIEGMGGLTEKVSRGEVGRRAGAELDWPLFSLASELVRLNQRDRTTPAASKKSGSINIAISSTERIRIM